MAKKSGDPRKRAQQYERTPRPAPDVSAGPTSASAWVSHVAADVEDVALPSGNIARVRRVGPEAFLHQGLIPDTVTPIVEKAIASKKGLRPVDQKKLMNDPAQLGSVLEMMDRVLVYAVVEPKVFMPPGCDYTHQDGTPDMSPEDYVCGKLNTPSEHPESLGHDFVPGPRDEGVLYADRVDLDDKVFIMNFVSGGTRDLERFRREFGAGLAGVSAREGSEGQAV